MDEDPGSEGEDEERPGDGGVRAVGDEEQMRLFSGELWPLRLTRDTFTAVPGQSLGPADQNRTV